MNDKRSTPFTTQQSVSAPAAAPAAPPVQPISTDPSDAPMRILLNWVILCGGLGAILFVGGIVL